MKKFLEITRFQHHKLTVINIVYFVLTLPLLFCLYVLANTAFGVSAGEAVVDVLPGLGFYMSLFAGWSRWVLLLAIAVSGLLYGPVKCLFFELLLAFYRGEYRFFTDIWSKNLKKLNREVPAGILDLLICGLLLGNLSGFFTWPVRVHWIILLGSGIALIFWLQVRRYLFLMTAATDLGFWPCFKNSVILSVSGLGNAGKSIAGIIVIAAITYLIIPIITVVVLPIAYYWTNFMFMSCCLYPEIERTVLRD